LIRSAVGASARNFGRLAERSSFLVGIGITCERIRVDPPGSALWSLKPIDVHVSTNRITSEVDRAVLRYLKTLEATNGAQIDSIVCVDDFGHWTPEHYRWLCVLVGNAFYRESTRHWAETSRRQRELQPRCGVCSVGPPLDAHHLHPYSECAGEEVPGVDLESLCRRCHMEEHRSARESRRKAAKSAG
jgi:hypothetical protein